MFFRYLRNIFVNIGIIISTDFGQLINENKTLKYLQKKNSEEKQVLSETCLALQAALYGLTNKNKNEYIEESLFLIRNGFSHFPYESTNHLNNISTGLDLLPFVIHNGKKLFFPGSYLEKKAGETYINYIENECILGGNYKKKQPHQYQTYNFKIEIGDVLFDIGCAEALISLDSIDIIDKLILVEGDSLWIEPLQKTFMPFKDKVQIINKYISNKASKNSVTLSSLLQPFKDKSVFIKLDIEGAEYETLLQAKNILSEMKNIKIVCCTYHLNNDADRISKLLLEIGFSIEFSDGYMLYNGYDTPVAPYFRKGLIRAKKTK